MRGHSIFFYLGCQKKCKCGKTEGGLVSRESCIYDFNSIKRWISYKYTNMKYVFIALKSFIGEGILSRIPIYHSRGISHEWYVIFFGIFFEYRTVYPRLYTLHIIATWLKFDLYKYFCVEAKKIQMRYFEGFRRKNR